MVFQVVTPQLLMSCPCALLTMVTEQGLCPLDQETMRKLCRGLSLPCTLPIHWYVAVKQRSGPWALGITKGGSQLTSSGSGHVYLHTVKISPGSVAHRGQGKEKEDDGDEL